MPSSCRKVWPSIRRRSFSASTLRRGAVGLRQDHHELVAAVARGDVGVAHRGADQEADLAQRAAAAQVAVGVVDRLEAVEVDEQQRQRAAVAVDQLQLAVERLVEVAEVVERRDLVGDRHLARLLQQAHVLEGERHGVGQRLQPRERARRRRPLGLRAAEREHADRVLARAQRQQHVGAQALLEQPHVLEEAVLLHQVALHARAGR